MSTRDRDDPRHTAQFDSGVWHEIEKSRGVEIEEAADVVERRQERERAKEEYKKSAGAAAKSSTG